MNIPQRVERAKRRFWAEVERYSMGWDESKHPRGNTHNAGQFSSTPGGGASHADGAGQAGGAAKPPAAGQSGSGGASGSTAPAKPQAPSSSQGGTQPAQGQQPQIPNSAPPAIKAAAAESGQLNEPRTAPPPGGYNPNPASGKAARVGVPGMVVPPPPNKIPRLNNLTPEERKHEEAFAQSFESNPDGKAEEFIQAMANGLGDGPNVFATDEAKCLYKPWAGKQVALPDGKFALDDATKAFRSEYNTPLHQTANAITKRAFVKYLDNVVSKLPEEKKHLVVTAGGCGAGKGFAIKGVDRVKALNAAAGVVWDSAGDQNSTELDWLESECKKRGMKMTVVFVHADPVSRWSDPKAGVIQRAGVQGRMVDARIVADSYTYGAQNYHKFSQKHAANPNVETIVLDNTRPPKGKDEKGRPIPDIVQLPGVPEEMLTMKSDDLYAKCLQTLHAANPTPAVEKGATAGLRIWPESGGKAIA